MDQRQEATESFQAQAQLYRQIFNYISSMSLKCCVQLGIPDIIHNHGEPITLSELVSALGIDIAQTNCMYRLMRMLVHSGIFATTTKLDHKNQLENEAYVLTPLSQMLIIKGQTNCLSPIVKLMLDPVLVNPWHFFGDWIQQQGTEHHHQTTLFESANGKSLWDYMDKDSQFKSLFHGAMESDSQMMNLVIKNCKPVFEGLDSLVDVGGGTGTVARVISEAYPQLKCTVFDLPHVVANLPAASDDKLNFIGGDLFQYIPSADAILMKLVLHGFGDEDCIKILKRCREAISTDEGGKGKGKIIIIDIVINLEKDEHELTEAKLLFDMAIMVTTPGRERTEQDWEILFKAAGFSDYKITPIFGLRSLIELYP